MSLNLISDLRGAVERDEIVAYYQPQVELESLDVIAVEALARWVHPDFGLISPGVFIPMAEAHELIHDIDCFMVDEATRSAATWHASGIDIVVAVNISASELRTLDCLDHLQRNLEKLSLPPEKLVIEVTESLPVINVAEVITRLHELRALGLGISIDDFGTGYSSLAQLVGIPATEMKLDKCLIQDEHTSQKLLRAVVDSAHDEGLTVVAEGIETEQHLEIARALGCDRGQGYLFGRPVPAQEFSSILRRGPSAPSAKRASRPS
jgi:EAL domain-containing protein (putative c-di-GMP-specific phosphodiesterase class I)